ncbi:hypothetical protein GW17_00025818 [Ensete ventricosum]|nr:hypothetical protein GW17_00025818 [Ensete ventricosum]
MSLEGLSYSKAKRRLERRWTWRSATVPQRRIYRSRRKRCRCKVTDSRVLGLAAPWYRRDMTSVESSIPCSHGVRSFSLLKGSIRINKDQPNSADATPKSVISELKQHDRLEFDYSTVAAESNWEPRGMLKPEQKIKDSAKGKEMQRL